MAAALDGFYYIKVDLQSVSSIELTGGVTVGKEAATRLGHLTGITVC